MELRRQLLAFLDQPVTDPNTGIQVAVGNYKFGVYAFFDYDGEPIYVGQTNERLRTRIRRHLTNQRTDAVAMKVLDPFEVYEIEVWPLPQYEALSTSANEAKKHLNWLELNVFRTLLNKSHFKAVLNEKDPADVPDNSYALPVSSRGKVVSDAVYELRKHPDTRIARRAETLFLLAKVISERQVQKGLRRTLLTQAKRLAWLAERRLTALPDVVDEVTEINDEQ
jgi:hypothetical protein